MAVLDRYQAGKVALLADGSVPGGVTFAFTEPVASRRVATRR